MKKESPNYRLLLLLLILISTLIRGFLAAVLELGNDEVYYRLYALYPDWSHFDHPPMVGWVIQLFSLNLLWQNEFFLRLGSVVIGAVNTWIIFKIGKKIRNERTGFFSALLYFSSIYSTVITGIFILPDTPQVLFWLSSILLMLKILPEKAGSKSGGGLILLLGLTIGLAVLSKYTSVYLWLGTGLYILLFNRKWLKRPQLYLALLITFACSLPILIWNYQNHFVSFIFQGSRVGGEGFSFNFNTFITELTGEIFYNNPINFVIILLALYVYFKKDYFIDREKGSLILLNSLPLIATFLLASLFRATLPHWTAPAYTTLIVFGAAWVDKLATPGKWFPYSIMLTVFLLVVAMIFSYNQIEYGIFKFKEKDKITETGGRDPSLDLYGYKQVGERFREIVRLDQLEGTMPEYAVLIGTNWFPLANYDYYAATPLGMKSLGIGRLDQIHKFAWTNRINGCFNIGMYGYFITDSRHYQDPYNELGSYFEEIVPRDTIEIYRGGNVAKLAFVYQLKNMKSLPDDPLFFR